MGDQEGVNGNVGALVPAVGGEIGTRAAGLVQKLKSITEEDLQDLDAVIEQQETNLDAMRRFRRMAAAVIVPPKKSGPPPGTKPKPKTEKKNAVELKIEKIDLRPELILDPLEGVAPGVKGEERQKKLLGIRKQIVIYVNSKGRAVRSGEILKDLRVGPRIINEVLDHEWFSQSTQGVHITPQARQEVLES